MPVLGLDEIALAKEFDSRDEKEAALLRFIKVLVETDDVPALHLHEEAREAGWSDEQILEAVAHVSLASFTQPDHPCRQHPGRRVRRGRSSSARGLGHYACTAWGR